MATYPAGQATFTNGDKTVTVTSLDSGTLTGFGSGTILTVGSNPVARVVAVESVNAAAGTFTLQLNWPLNSGSYAFFASMQTEGLADAVIAQRDLINLVGTPSANPVGDTVVKRDGSGRVKGASSVASDDLVPMGQLGDSAFLESYKDYGLASNVGLPSNNWSGDIPTGFYNTSTVDINRPPWSTPSNMPAIHSRTNSDRSLSIVSGSNGDLGFRTEFGGTYSDWFELYHSGNVNPNKFGGNASGDAPFPIHALAESSSRIAMKMPVSFVSGATGISISGTFSIIDVLTFATVTSGVTASAFTFDSRSSAKSAKVIVDVSGVFTAGREYELRTESSGTYLQVNGS